MSILYLPLSIVGVRGRAALRSFGPVSRRGYVGMGADKGKPALSRRAGSALVEAQCYPYTCSRHNAKRQQ